MIRRHPWRSLTLALVLMLPLLPGVVAYGLWWAFQGRKSFGRP